MPDADVERPLWQTVLYFASMIAILVFANWGKPTDPSGFWQSVLAAKWMLTGISAIVLAVILVRWYGFSWWKVALGAVATALCAFLFPCSKAL